MARDDSALGGLIGFIIAIAGTAVILKIIDEATKERRPNCPRCGHQLFVRADRCSNCKVALRWA